MFTVGCFLQSGNSTPRGTGSSIALQDAGIDVNSSAPDEQLENEGE